MPGRSNKSSTMGEHIQRIVAELAQADLAPDADHDFINQVRTQIIGYHQASQGQGAGPQGGQPGLGQQQMPGMQAPPGAPPGMPTVDGEGLSRGPNPNPDMSGATGELQRILSGA